MAVGIDADKSPAPRHVVSVLGGGTVAGLAWLLVAPPTTGPQWIMLGLVSFLVGLFLTAAASLLLNRVGRLGARRRAVALPILVTATVLAAGSVVAAVVTTPDEASAHDCVHPVELRILTSPGGLPTARELAESYQQWTALADGGGCPAVASYVYSVPSETAVEELQDGWSGTALQQHGPRPDLWLPASTSDVDAVREAVASTDSALVGLDAEVIAASPLVLAVAAPAAAGAADHRQLLSWAALPGETAQFGWQLVRPDPAVSEVGDLVTTALYGRSLPDSDAVALARQTETRIAQGLDDGDYPLADTAALLQRHRQRGDAAATTALLVTEQAMVRFNQDSLAGAVSDPGSDPAATRLVAFYPTDPLTSDLAVVSLTWQDPVAAPTRAAVTELRRWLSGEAGRAALVAAGLRPVGHPLGEPSFPLVPELGVLPEALPADQIHRPPAPGAAQRAREIYAAAQRPGRVLLALDASGSMAEPVGGSPGDPDGGAADVPLTRLDVATRGVTAALQLLGDRDEFGLWVFGPPGERELVPIGAATAQLQGTDREQAAADALAPLNPDGPTPLYRTILDGVAAVGGGDGDRVTALVVLTDGEDSEQDPATIEALAAVGGQGVRVFVVAVGEASCRVDALVAVTARTGGECVPADFDTLTSQLAELFGVLWSGGSDGG